MPKLFEEDLQDMKVSAVVVDRQNLHFSHQGIHFI